MRALAFHTLPVVLANIVGRRSFLVRQGEACEPSDPMRRGRLSHARLPQFHRAMLGFWSQIMQQITGINLSAYLLRLTRSRTRLIWSGSALAPVLARAEVTSVPCLSAITSETLLISSRSQLLRLPLRPAPGYRALLTDVDVIRRPARSTSRVSGFRTLNLEFLPRPTERNTSWPHGLQCTPSSDSA